MEAKNLHLTFPAELKEIPGVFLAVEDWISKESPDRHRCSNIKLILDELLSNICHYAELPDDLNEIELTVHRESDSIVLTVRDSGIPFNPLEKKPPDLTLSLEERPIGGLGIFLVQRLSKQTEYRRENNQNVLTVWIDS